MFLSVSELDDGDDSNEIWLCLFSLSFMKTVGFANPFYYYTNPNIM